MANDTQRPFPEEKPTGDADAIADKKPEILENTTNTFDKDGSVMTARPDTLINEERLRFESVDDRYINKNGVKPHEEACDGVDDNCDGLVDDDLTPAVIYTGKPSKMDVGICRAEIQTCTYDRYSVKQPGVKPHEEACDGVDEDCTGRMDDEK
ncbi:MopE-related protein [Candidatus Gracilibacteria bacterium]|jgi:hypothetical protein|nr:MopE-related protein [Candidatus Gracilibacteria bacterium]